MPIAAVARRSDVHSGLHKLRGEESRQPRGLQCPPADRHHAVAAQGARITATEGDVTCYVNTFFSYLLKVITR